jgi:hypothetical protein
MYSTGSSPPASGAITLAAPASSDVVFQKQFYRSAGLAARIKPATGGVSKYDTERGSNE